MNYSDPKIDFTQLEFPSDKLTVKMLRQAWPSAFDVDPRNDLGGTPHRIYARTSLDGILGEGIIDAERELAERAFKIALGQPKSSAYRQNDQHELISSLHTEYCRCGLARGEHEVSQMIRRIEAQAEAQAGKFGGKPL